jgi:flagellar basal-body rod protein FlgF
MESLEMLANNLANTNTGGYKADREFYSLYVAPEAVDPMSGAIPDTLPVIERHWTDFTQGILRFTGNSLDLALTGRGFFAAQGPTSALYTRNGNFRLSPQGVLTTAEGYPLRTTTGENIRSQTGDPLEFSSDGTVSQSGAQLGKLELVDFTRLDGLVKQGQSYFRNTDPVLAPPAPATAQLEQGKLEGSNVGSAEGAVRLVGVMRQFEMLQRAITLGGEMNRRAIEEVARVGQ